MPAPADRTATLPSPGPAPIEPVGPPRADPAAVEALPIDDPDRYEKIYEHARGGLGRIVRAIDKRLGRTVAVKELLRTGDGSEARFMREALITARLEHPGIVPVHEAGRWPNGDPYYVMKLVEGRTLKALIAEQQTMRDRLGLLPHVIALADAVGYAHSEGVIHRDIKPSNVIVGGFGETIVVDWGLACDRTRAAGEVGSSDGAEPTPRAAGSGAATISGKVIGTPGYMSPEQARGEIVDERADVYAIGAVLYELLAGRAPHVDDTPQATLDRVIAGPPPPVGELAPTAPPELADIVAKAMARAADERYPNATAVAEDLRRFQTGKLVSAHAYTPWQLVRKRLAHHRGVVVVAAASAVVLGAVGVESLRTVVAERDIARTERARADTARQVAESRRRELVLVQAETSLQKDPTATLAWLKLNPIASRDVAEVVDVVDEALALGVARHVFRAGDWVFDAAFTPDGTTLVAAARDGVLRAYDLRSGAMRELGRSPSPLGPLAISPDGTLAVTGGSLGDVLAWPLAAGGPRTLIAHGRMVEAVRFDATGAHVVVDHESGPADLVAVAGDAEPTRVGPESALRVAIADRDWSRRIALVEPDRISALEPGGGRRDVARTDRPLKSIALSPDGDTIVAHDGATAWTVPFAGGTPKRLADYDGVLGGVVWSPDRRTLVLYGGRSDVALVELATGAMRELRGHGDAIYSAQFTRDGRTLVTASDDGTARVWNLGDGSSIALRGHDDDVYRARLSADERFVATASLDGSVRVWAIDPERARVLAEGSAISGLELDGDRATVKTAAGLARWDLATGTRTPVLAWQRGVAMAVPSPSGELVVVPGPNWTLELRGRTGAPVVLRGHRGPISHLEFARDGNTVYSSSFDGTLRAWDVRTGAGALLVDGKLPVRGFAVAADGRIAAQVADSAVLIGADGSVRTLGSGPKFCGVSAEFERVRDRLIVQRCDHALEVIDHDRKIELATDGYAVVRVAVSPDGERFAGAMSDRTVRVWDARGHVIAVLRGHGDLVLDVAFAPDGRTLASASYDKTIRLWDLAHDRHRVLRGHGAAVERIAWRDRDRLVSASRDGTLRVWTVPSLEPPAPAELTRRLDAATTARIDDANRATSLP